MGCFMAPTFRRHKSAAFVWISSVITIKWIDICGESLWARRGLLPCSTPLSCTPAAAFPTNVARPRQEHGVSPKSTRPQLSKSHLTRMPSACTDIHSTKDCPSVQIISWVAFGACSLSLSGSLSPA
eukprot:6466305-Amphidinium_carterae.1